MAKLGLSLNEGSLLRRTVLHVAVFVLGTAAFLALTSFLLVTVLKGALSPEEKGSSGSGDDSSEEAATTASSTSPRPRPPRKKRSPAPVAPAPAADEE